MSRETLPSLRLNELTNWELVPNNYAKTSVKDTDEKTHKISLEHVEEATEGTIFENPGERGILKKGYSKKQDYNEKTHIMSLGHEEEAIRDMIFNNPGEGGIPKTEYAEKKRN